MELRKLLDKIWELVEEAEIDGGTIPNLDICEQELRILTDAYAEIKIKKEKDIEWRIIDEA